MGQRRDWRRAVHSKPKLSKVDETEYMKKDRAAKWLEHNDNSVQNKWESLHKHERPPVKDERTPSQKAGLLRKKTRQKQNKQSDLPPHVGRKPKPGEKPPWE